MADEFKDVDLYELFSVLQSATGDEIKKAYRKKALTCHPDKNPDNPKAAEQFQRLSKALEVLLDISARAAYDRVINAKKAAKLRHQELDSKRKKFKEELEAREKEAELRGHAGSSYSTKTDEEKLQAEIERLRKEGSKQLREEIELMRQWIEGELRNDRCRTAAGDGVAGVRPCKRVKVRWTAAKDDDSNGGYNEENLRRIFNKYGEIEVLILSKKKKGSALVEFVSSDPARKAEMLEKGLPDNPLKVELIVDKAHHSNTKMTPDLNRQEVQPEISSRHQNESGSRDYESLVMRQLRQAEERKRLIQQMQAQDEEDGT